MRYNSKERIGVNITEYIFINEFDWIFREQSIVDVGIDAFVEEADGGEPTGKFLALQIKTGEGNFHISSDKITYYISNVHYEYWTNFDIPVILIAHLENENKTYWQEISIKKIRKTDKKWKLEIPYRNILNKTAKSHLITLLSSKNNNSDILKIFRDENIDNNNFNDLDSRIDLITDATESVIKIVEILKELQVKIKASGEKFQQHTARGELFNTPAVQNSVKSFAKYITLGSRRLEQEILIFSEVFGEGIYAFEQSIFFHFTFTKNLTILEKALKSVEGMSQATESAISGIIKMRKGFEKIPDNVRELKSVKINALKVVDLMIAEHTDAKLMIDNLIQQIKSRL